MAQLLVWDAEGARLVEHGISKGILFKQTDGVYGAGVVWNGLVGVTEAPSGADITDLYADDIQYISLRAAEKFGATVEAYTYPDEFAECDGSAEPEAGLIIGQQARKRFGLAYRTLVHSDTDSESENHYKLHLVYGASAAPSERPYTTINESPEAINFSWELTTQPVAVPGFKPTSILTIDSIKATAPKMAALELILYGQAAVPAVPAVGIEGEEGYVAPIAAIAAVPARLPLPSEIITLFAAA